MSALHSSRTLRRQHPTTGRRHPPFSSPGGRVSTRTPTALRPLAAAAAGAPASSNPTQAPAPADAASALAASALLQWACSGPWDGLRLGDPGDDGAARAASGGAPAGLGLRVAARELGPGRGRGLVAVADVSPGEALLSVPLTRVFTSEPESELHWSAEMAMRLLRARHLAAAEAAAAAAAAQRPRPEAMTAGAAAPGGGPSPSREGGIEAGPEALGEAGWGPWIAALPQHVRTPLEYGEEEVRQLGCPYVMEEVAAMQQCIRDCYEVLQSELEELGCGWAEFLWAVQVFHSRCFFEPSAGLHMCVPGVDLANHSAQPSAGVQLQHSPGACQGYDALAEVAEPPPPEPSRFNLVAGEAGIRCGEEVTISYGRWPSEAFLLLFGFVPLPLPAGGCASGGSSGGGDAGGGGSGSGDVSPGDSLVVFRDAEEGVRWCVAAAAAAGPQRPEQQQQEQPGSLGEERTEAEVQAILQALGDAMPNESFLNLAVTMQGVDGRLQGLLEVVSRQLGGAVGPRDMLVRRLRERLEHFDNVDCGRLSDDAIGLFVRSKRALARHVLTQLG